MHSAQKINNACNNDIRNYYYKLDITTYNKSYNTDKTTWELIHNKKNKIEIETSLRSIEKAITEKQKEGFVDVFETTLAPNSLTETEKYLYATFYKVIEFTQRALFLKNANKPYAIYCMLRTEINKTNGEKS